MEIRKVVIPIAGYGTRMLPMSLTTPKAMLPIVDRPLLHQVVEEAVACGINQVIIVIGPRQQAPLDYFTRVPQLEAHLEERIRPLLKLREEVQFTYVLQEEYLGLGHAVAVTRKAVGDEPFAVMLPDDVIVGQPPPMRRLLKVAQEQNASAIAVEKVPLHQISAYGIIRSSQIEDDLYQVSDLVEKPAAEKAPSDLAIIGRYVFTPRVFDALETISPGAGGELQLTDGLASLLKEQRVFAVRLRGSRFDAGTPIGLLKASIALALKRPEIGPELREWLQHELNQSGTNESDIAPRTTEN
jgi:UTP--glucose-1-phosphate uridylyltransferase